jgi:hypothetical protein
VIEEDDARLVLAALKAFGTEVTEGPVTVQSAIKLPPIAALVSALEFYAPLTIDAGGAAVRFAGGEDKGQRARQALNDLQSALLSDAAMRNPE